MSDLILSPAEIQALTGKIRPKEQLAVLLDRGFKASIPRKGGTVVQTRTNYEAVLERQANPPEPEPEPFDYSHMARPAQLHWRKRPEHQERLRLEREAWLAEHEHMQETARKAREHLATVAAELARTRPERRAVLVRFHASRRRVSMLKRTPPWADQAAIKAIYAEALRMKRETGVEHHVDHIYPLHGELVSGLHVENNLQVLPWRENVMKRNKFEVEA